MIIEYIERLRAKPVEVRRRFVYVASIVLTGCIVLVWLSVLLAAPDDAERAISAPASSTQSDVGSWTRLKTSFQSLIGATEDVTTSPDVSTVSDSQHKPGAVLPPARFESSFTETAPPGVTSEATTTATTTTPESTPTSSISPPTQESSFVESVVKEVAQP